MFGRRLIKSNDEGSGASFNTVTYTGNGSTQSITGVGFQPDFVWVKSRSAATSNKLTDVVRGTTKGLVSNTAAEETTDTNGLTAFGSDGFTLGTDSVYNTNTSTYVAWCWKAGGAAVTNTDGSSSSEVSANVDAGFSIVKHSGTMVSGQTFGHGLSAEPEIIINKITNVADYWWTFFPSVLGNSNVLDLSRTIALSAVGITYSGNSSTFGISWTGGTYDFIHYCFHSVAGFSKFGSYTGNSPSPITITTGFEPAMIIVKSYSWGSNKDWVIYDNKRGEDKYLFSNTVGVEGTYNNVDFTSTGFNIVDTGSSLNQYGTSYIYMAFANQF